MSDRVRERLLLVWIIGFTALVFLALWQAHEAREDLEAVAIANCLEIEQVKAGARAAAWRDFNRLNQNLELLGLKKTAAIVDAAKDTRDRRLTQYRREPCPRQILSPPN